VTPALRAANPPTIASWIEVRIDSLHADAAPTFEEHALRSRRVGLLRRILEDPALGKVRTGIRTRISLGIEDVLIEAWALPLVAEAEEARP
jgi:hypothetical protein